MENEEKGRRPHIVFLPTPGMGHLIPITQLAKLLIQHHNFTITLILFSESSNNAQKTFLSSLPSSITSLSLPPIPLSDLPPNSPIETRISVAASRSVPSLRSLLQNLLTSTNLLAFVADLFASPASDAAISLNIPHFIFIPTNLLFLTLLFQLPTLHANLPCNFSQLKHPILLPGFPPIPGPDILHPLQDRTKDSYHWMLQHAIRYRQSHGILVNTFDAIEPEAAKLLKREEPGRPIVYPIGPLIRPHGAAGEHGAECLKWLDSQPNGSVLFVSFGSGGTLSREQFGELAFGLEESGQRFVWVVRSPMDMSSSGSYFSAKSEDDDPFGYLPEGFLERNEGIGMVVSSWAPQVDVLRHGAVGGFLTHCGWNSTMESLGNGVPIIVWPLFAEQRMNAIYMVEGVKVGMRLRERGDGVYDRREIGRVVRELMEGEEGERVRRRAREIAAEAKAAMEDGGSSLVALADVAEKWKGFSNEESV